MRAEKIWPPHPKKVDFGVQKFLQNRIFGPNFSSFRLWEVSRAPKWFGRHQKLFTRTLEPLWCGPKKFRPPHPKKVDFGGAEIPTKPILTVFGQNNFFDHFFELVEGRSLGSQMLREWPVLAKNA